jgi:hypothetical protein
MQEISDSGDWLMPVDESRFQRSEIVWTDVPRPLAWYEGPFLASPSGSVAQVEALFRNKLTEASCLKLWIMTADKAPDLGLICDASRGRVGSCESVPVVSDHRPPSSNPAGCALLMTTIQFKML